MPHIPVLNEAGGGGGGGRVQSVLSERIITHFYRAAVTLKWAENNVLVRIGYNDFKDLVGLPVKSKEDIAHNFVEFCKYVRHF
jgi:hypothetical protein